MEIGVHGGLVPPSRAGGDTRKRRFLPGCAAVETHTHEVGLQVVPHPGDYQVSRVGRVHSYTRFKFVTKVHVAARSETSIATSQRVRVLGDLDEGADFETVGAR